MRELEGKNKRKKKDYGPELHTNVMKRSGERDLPLKHKPRGEAEGVSNGKKGEWKPQEKKKSHGRYFASRKKAIRSVKNLGLKAEGNPSLLAYSAWIILMEGPNL